MIQEGLSTNIKKVQNTQSDRTIGHCETIAIQLAKVTIKDFRTDHLRDKLKSIIKGSSIPEEKVSS